jgi:endonuclease/exonuclease/phosphatase family metal-dependent hydrolase
LTPVFVPSVTPALHPLFEYQQTSSYRIVTKYVEKRGRNKNPTAIDEQTMVARLLLQHSPVLPRRSIAVQRCATASCCRSRFLDRMRVMCFDQVRVVAIHLSYETRKRLDQAFREPTAKRGGALCQLEDCVAKRGAMTR